MSVMLWRQKAKRLQNRLLASIVFVLGLENWGTYCYSTGLIATNSLFYCSSFSLLLALGPLLYGYSLSLTKKRIHWQKRHLLHLAPLLIQVVNHQSFFLIETGELWVDPHFWNTSRTIEQYVTAISVFAYVYRCQRLIQPLAGGLLHNNSEVRHLSFLTNIYWALLVINLTWSLYLVFKLFDASPIMSVTFYGLHILLSALIYWMAIEGYLLHRESIPSLSHQKSRLATQSVNNEQLADQLQRIKDTVEVQEAYLQSDLTLERLAQQTGIHAKTLSQLINQQVGLNFNDFINRYRVLEAQRRLVSQAYEHLTIEGIAQDVGFSSKTTFNRAFREVTKMSAREYKKSQETSTSQV